jgi:hypothetical protein
VHAPLQSAPFGNFSERHPEDPSFTSESGSFESSFFGLSRVNDSLKQINLVHRETGLRILRKSTLAEASPKRERIDSGGENANRCTLFLIML